MRESSDIAALYGTSPRVRRLVIVAIPEDFDPGPAPRFGGQPTGGPRQTMLAAFMVSCRGAHLQGLAELAHYYETQVPVKDAVALSECLHAFLNWERQRVTRPYAGRRRAAGGYRCTSPDEHPDE